MTSEEELKRWLNRSEKTFPENVQFAINCWNSAEFSVPQKYEIILSWFTKKLFHVKKHISDGDLQWETINEFVSLRCSPGLVSLDVKNQYVLGIAKFSAKWECNNSRQIVELLEKLMQHESLQDYLKTNGFGFCQLVDKFLSAYAEYLEKQERLLVAHETAFFNKFMSVLKDYVKKVGNVEQFEKLFTANVLKTLAELIITLRSNNLNFFDDLLEIHKVLYLDYDKTVLSEAFRDFPIHVNLLNFECAIVNFRGDTKFVQKFISMVFRDFKLESSTLTLTVSAYVLEMFKKYDINLNFKINEKVSIVEFLGTHIGKFVQDHHDQNLYEVLLLLCSTLRLNPLILDSQIFSIVISVLAMRKWEKKEQEKYEEFLILVIDMYKKLSRAEKFVVNFMKALKEFLSTNTISKKGKRKPNTEEEKAPEKKAKLDISAVSTENSSPTAVEKYLNILFKNFQEKKVEIETEGKQDSFTSINFAWPTRTVGFAFSKLILSLMSKPSLTIWKSIVYILKDCLKVLKTSPTDENTLFLVDFASSWLCQYFAGCKLHEQSDKFWKEIKDNRNLTRNTLKEFGQLLLDMEHNNRTMNAFQECAYYAGYFDLVLWYYRPDSLKEDSDFSDLPKTIHDYLTSNEWTLIEQRIINFGKPECKINLNRLCLQRVTAKLLFHDRKSVNIQKAVLNSTFSDAEQIKAIFSDRTNFWILQHLKPEEVENVCEFVAGLKDVGFLLNFTENAEVFEKIVLVLYKNISEAFKGSKKSILANLDLFESEEKINAIFSAFNKKDVQYVVKKFSVENVEAGLEVLAQVPFGALRLQTKTIVFALQLALYRDLIAAGNTALAEKAFELFSNILQFGQPINIFKYFDIEKLLAVIPPTKAYKFYHFLFGTLKLDIDNGELFLQKVVALLKENESSLSGDLLQLLVITIAEVALPSAHKKFKKHLNDIYPMYSNCVTKFFAEDKKRSTEDEKNFVEMTLPVYSSYISSVLTKLKNPEDLDENLRRISKIYIGSSMDYRNSPSVKLFTVALQHREALHFDPDEIDFVLKKYWQQLNDDLRSGNVNKDTAEAVLKLILDNKTNEDFLKMLKEFGKTLKPEDFAYICRTLSQISKCHLTTIKGAIFNEHFKLINFGMILRLEKNNLRQFTDVAIVQSLLDCQTTFCENVMIPISCDTLDVILSFLIDVDIKKFPVTDENTDVFNNLHKSMTQLSTVILKHRHVLLMDRIPQFAHVFRDLMQAVCWYKSDRKKDTVLDEQELESLVKLCLKMESLMHLIATHGLEVKRIAPYLLTFTINLMVSNDRPTTLYPNIKRHFENICYDLITVCDHRVGRFILRCSNEASRQVYETLCNEHKKNFKFKGKV